MAAGEQFDSGMESQEGSISNSTKDRSPEKKLEIENDFDDEVSVSELYKFAGFTFFST